MPITKGPDKGKFQVHEACHFEKRVKTKHLQEASCIMDAENRVLIKNAAKEKGATYDDIEAHVIKGYKDKYLEFLKITEVEIPEVLLTKEEDEEADATTEEEE